MTDTIEMVAAELLESISHPPTVASSRLSNWAERLRAIANPAPPTSGPLMKCVCGDPKDGGGCTNKCDRGQIPPLPAATYRVTDSKLQQVPTPADESGADVRGPMRAWVGDMKTSAGMDYYVCVGWPSDSILDKTYLTPSMYKIRGRAEYDVAEWNHLLGHCEKPDILAFDTEPAPEPRAAAQEARGIATGDTATFADVWTKLQPVERAIISAHFCEPSRAIREYADAARRARGEGK